MTPTVPVRSSGSSPASLTRRTRGQPPARATFSRATVLEELAEPITTTASDSAAIALSAAWRLVVAKQRSLRLGIQRSGKRWRAASMRPRHSSWLSVVWANRATGASAGIEVAQRLEVLLVLEQADRLGGHGHGADRLLVTGVADVEHGVALAAADLQLVVDLRDEGADRIDDDAFAAAG